MPTQSPEAATSKKHRQRVARPAEQLDRWRALYLAGSTDRDIAKTEGVGRFTVQAWRRRESLPAHPPRHRISPEEEAKRKELHSQGLSDTRIGRILGCDPSHICAWRKSRGLKGNFPASPGLDEGQNAARMALYKLGYSDGRIARTQHVPEWSISAWRKRRGLPSNNNPPAHKNRRVECVDAIFERIKKAVGRRLSPDIVDDTVAQLYIDVVSGKIAIGEIEKVARKYANQTLDTYASKFGPRSIDEAVEGTEDLRLIDTLRDESSSFWLEEMGATVW